MKGAGSALSSDEFLFLLVRNLSIRVFADGGDARRVGIVTYGLPYEERFILPEAIRSIATWKARLVFSTIADYYVPDTDYLSEAQNVWNTTPGGNHKPGCLI